MEKYALQIPFTQFYGIKTVIERFMMQSQIDMVNVSRANCNLPFNIKSILKNKKGCKVMYDVLNSKNIIPKSQLKWNVVFEYTRLNWNVLYSIPIVCCHDTKLHWFQYRILHSIIATNNSLTKMHIRQNNTCSFCNNEVEKIEHLFWQCNIVNEFWENVDQWLYNKTEYMININKQKAIFGIEQIKPLIRPINYILIVTRYYIYKCRISNKKFNLNAWESTVKQFLEIEKLIAIKNNKYDVFLKTLGYMVYQF